MRKIILMIAFGGSVACNAQSITPSVVAAAGQHFANSTAQLSWTTGEVVIQTVTSTNNIITQGFHQPDYSFVAVEENLPVYTQINVFPNPAKDQLTVQFSNSVFSYTITLYDITGKSISTQTVPAFASSGVVEMTGLATGQYLLQVVSTDWNYYTTKKINKIN